MDGNILWKKNYGGSGTDYFYSVIQSYHGYVAFGYSNSTNGDLTGLNKGGSDAIIMKIDYDGNIL